MMNIFSSRAQKREQSCNKESHEAEKKSKTMPGIT
jgi:hypothetical protein